ncbi:MAG: cytochrome c [Gammaproteobacteria bacterium]
MRSRVRSGVLFAITAFTALACTAIQAQEAAAGAGNAEHGKAISYTCLGCHGIPGYRNAYPNYSVPKLEGQHPEYIVIALTAYRAGERSHLTMHSQASTLSDQDMLDIAAYFSGKPLKTGNAPVGKTPDSAQVCVACHGPDGVGITPQYPSLAGQHADYIERALHDYKKGGRKNPIMGTFAAQVKDEDVKVLAEYYSKQKPSLETEARPSTVLTMDRSVKH